MIEQAIISQHMEKINAEVFALEDYLKKRGYNFSEAIQYIWQDIVGETIEFSVNVSSYCYFMNTLESLNMDTDK